MAQQGQSGTGGGKIFYLIGGLVLVAGAAWLFVAGRGGSAADLPTPAEFEALALQVEADPSTGIPIGSASAPIELWEFVDYSCPACANFAGFAGRLLRQNYVETQGGPVRWVLYDYVLGVFPHSVAAHMAARCAGDQGLYWPLHDQLFSRQQSWSQSNDAQGVIADIAESIGVDMGTYRECMNDESHLQQIAASRKYGESLGVGSTPTVFLDGEMLDLVGKEPYSYVEELIRAKLAEAAGVEGGADEGAGPGS